jgi:hypothetical protein
MRRGEIEEHEKTLMRMVVHRRQLGGYNADAADLLLLAEIQLKIIQHMLERTPRSKKEDE